MQRNFPRALDAVLAHEGGYADHPVDPGGATNMGITIATFRKWVKRNGTKADLRRITDAQVAKIYRAHYWNKVKGDELPSGIDYAVFDFAVNSGPGRAAKYLQGVLGVARDGIIGPKTIAAAHAADPRKVITDLCGRRMAFLRQLRTWPTFGRGWSSRVRGVRQLALSLAVKSAQRPEPIPVDPAPAETNKPSPARGWAAAIIAIGAAIFAFLKANGWI